MTTIKANDYQIHGFDASKLPEKRKIAWAVKIHQIKDGPNWAISCVDELTLTKEQYLNIASITVCKAFRWIGSTQKYTMTQTQYGYVPTEVISVSPSKNERIIYEIYFGNDGLTYMYRLSKWKTQKAKEKMLKAKKRM